jgi:hypothetical protein
MENEAGTEKAPSPVIQWQTGSGGPAEVAAEY